MRRLHLGELGRELRLALAGVAARLAQAVLDGPDGVLDHRGAAGWPWIAAITRASIFS
jgi:hypothetical protein